MDIWVFFQFGVILNKADKNICVWCFGWTGLQMVNESLTLKETAKLFSEVGCTFLHCSHQCMAIVAVWYLAVSGFF